MGNTAKRAAALVLAAALLTGVFAGCSREQGEGPSSSTQNITFQEEDYQSLWESCVCIASVILLEEDFASPQEINGNAALDYIVERMVADGSIAPYEEGDEALSTWELPQEVIFQRAEQYFGSRLEETLKEAAWYQPEKENFSLVSGDPAFNGNYPYGSYKVGENNTYVAIREAVDNGDGTITVVLEDYNRLQYTDKAGEKLQKLHHLTLRGDLEKGWQIVSKTSELVNQPEIKTQGFTPVEALGSLTAEDLNSGGASLVPWGEDLLIWKTDYNQDTPRTDCILLGPDGQVKGETAFTYGDVNDHLFDATPYGEDMAFYFRAGDSVKVTVLDKNFQEVKTLANLDQLAGEELYFETIALSPDGQTLAFVNDRGLYTVDVATGEKTLRGAHPKPATGPSPGQAGDMYKGIFFLDNSRLMARRVSYEAGPGYGYFDLGKNTVQLIDIPVGYSTSDYFDKDGFTVVRYQDDGPTLVQRYRFASGSFSVYEVPNTGFMPDPVPLGDMAYYFGNRDGETLLIALNLTNGKARETGISVSGVAPRIAAITSDNRVLFTYSAPSGGGIGLSEPHLGMDTAGM